MADGKPRKKYVKAKIIHELEMETRAGSPLRLDNMLPLDLRPSK
jgi:hypothetical protein